MPFVEQQRRPQPSFACVPIDTSFPEEQVNTLAKLESYNKHLFRPNTYLHKWWARRSGVTFRYILKHLVENAELRDYYTPGGLEGVTILDPMMGGGTTLHEAIRLGANVIGYDLDPIPVLQARASLARIPAREKEMVFQRFLGRLEETLRPYFLTRCPDCGKASEIQFTLWAARKSCGCREALIVDSLVLREETDGARKQIEDYYPGLRVTRGQRQWEILPKSDAHCRACGRAFGNNIDLPFAARYTPLIVCGTCPTHGSFFKAVDADDLTLDQRAKTALEQIALPDRSALRVVGGPKSGDLLNKRIDSYRDLFTARQLLYISSAKSLLEEVEASHREWLSALVSTSLEFNSILCGYKGADKRRAGAIRHVFSHHAYSFPHTALENNPVFSQTASGTLRRLFEDRVRDAGKWAAEPIERQPWAGGWRKVSIRGETDAGTACSTIADFAGHTRRYMVEQRDSSRMPLPDASVDFVVTDPPYFDSVQYSDLSHFFRVWLRWFLPDHADWDFEHGMSAVAETEAGGEKYRSVMAAIFRECNRVLRRPHGRLIFTFHHWRAEAWAQLTLSLRDAGFALVNHYTVHAENPVSVHIRQLNALKHDAILVLRPWNSANRAVAYEAGGVVSTADSYQFCRDCARILGQCLESPLTDIEIHTIWRAALGN